MARDLVYWCDPCLAEEVRTPGVEISGALNLTGDLRKALDPKVIAMCPEHIDQLAKPLAALLEDMGIAVDLPAPKKATAKKSISANPSGSQHEQTLLNFEVTGIRKGRAPVGPRGNQCLWCALSYSNDGGGFSRHLKVHHGFTGIKEAFGAVCPICGGGQYDALMGHLKKSHEEMGFETIPQAMLWAKDNGDEFGVYEETVNRKGSLDLSEAYEQVRAQERVANKEGGGTKGKKAPAKKTAAAAK